MTQAAWYRLAVVVAALFAVLYIAAKVQYAIDGRLGIYGGPQVTDVERALSQDSVQISQAQWVNVAVGALILALTLLPLVPAVHHWYRWIVATPLLLTGVALVVVGGITLKSAITNSGGGYLFGLYTTVWGMLLAILGLAHRTSRVDSGGSLRDVVERDGFPR